MSKCPPFPIVPGVSVCPGVCETLSLCKLPRRYPRTTALASLQTEYSFTNEYDFDAALSLKPEAYAIMSSNGDISTTTIDGWSPCDIEQIDGVTPLYSYINTILTQSAKAERETPWILDYTQYLDCSATNRTAGIRKGPAHVSLYNTIQELLPPPTATPTVQPGGRRGSGIEPPPDEPCNGTWVLTWEDGALKWVCSTEDTTISCSKLSITAVDIVDGNGKVIEKATISAIKEISPAVRVRFTYADNVAPQFSVNLGLVVSAANGDKKILSAQWSGGSLNSSVKVGPFYSSGNTGSISEELVFSFSWSSLNDCYALNLAESPATTVSCNVSFIACGIKKSSNQVTVTCDEALGVLSADLYITDDSGFRLDDGVIGSYCNEFRSGLFYINIDYSNNTGSMYIAADPGLMDIAFGGLVGVELEHPVITHAPSELAPGDYSHSSYAVRFRLKNDACSAEIPISVPAVSGVHTTVIINDECDSCPQPLIDAVYVSTSDTGADVMKSWDTNCAMKASLYAHLIIKFKSSVPGGDYVNTRGDKITIAVSDVSKGLYAIVNGYQSLDVAVPNFEYTTDGYVYELPIYVETDKDLPISNNNAASGSVTFSVTGAASGSGTLDVIKSCGDLDITVSQLFMGPPAGVDVEAIGEVNYCVPNADYNVFSVVTIYNKSDKDFVGTLELKFTIDTDGAVTGGVSDVPKTVTRDEAYPISAKSSVTISSPTVRVRVGDKLTGSITPSVALQVEGGAWKTATGSTLKVNPNCGGSSSSSSSSTSGCADGECCYIESSDNRVEIGYNKETGRCTISLANLPSSLIKGSTYITVSDPDNQGVRTISLNTAELESTVNDWISAWFSNNSKEC